MVLFNQHSALYDICGTPNEADIEGYAKVDQSNPQYKYILMAHCSVNFKKCAKEEFEKRKKEWEKKKEAGEVAEHERPNISDEKKKEIKECVHKSVFGNWSPFG